MRKDICTDEERVRDDGEFSEDAGPATGGLPNRLLTAFEVADAEADPGQLVGAEDVLAVAGERIQARRIEAGVARVPVPQAMFSATPEQPAPKRPKRSIQ